MPIKCQAPARTFMLDTRAATAAHLSAVDIYHVRRLARSSALQIAYVVLALVGVAASRSSGSRPCENRSAEKRTISKFRIRSAAPDRRRQMIGHSTRGGPR